MISSSSKQLTCSNDTDDKMFMWDSSSTIWSAGTEFTMRDETINTQSTLPSPWQRLNSFEDRNSEVDQEGEADDHPRWKVITRKNNSIRGMGMEKLTACVKITINIDVWILSNLSMLLDATCKANRRP